MAMVARMEMLHSSGLSPRLSNDMQAACKSIHYHRVRCRRQSHSGRLNFSQHAATAGVIRMRTRPISDETSV